MNIGAGRVVDQDLIRLNKSLSHNGIKNKETFLNAVEYAREKSKDFHIMGLLSEGGVHSHSNHLYEILEFLKIQKLKKIFLHLFTDGRDTSPYDGVNEISKLIQYLENTNISIASVSGRYYAMDRDSRWERIKLAYDAIVNGEGIISNNIVNSIKTSYNEAITDEFIKPIVCADMDGSPIGVIKDDDVAFSFNYRSDRMRQLSHALTQKDFVDFDMKKKNLYYMTMTSYDENLKKTKVLFDKKNIRKTLGEVLEENLSLIHI